MIINEPAPDYLTLGTFSLPVANTLLAELEKNSVAPLKDEKRMQYQGVRKGNTFLGSAEQLGRIHWLFVASGMDAAIAFNYASFLPCKSTRIDLQCTIELPKGWNHRATYDALKAATPGTSISLVESGDGFDTLYIGRRSSRRFMRLYIKPDQSGKPYLRFEVEYKAELADKMWQDTRKLDNPTRAWGNMLLGEAMSVKGFPPSFAGMMLTLKAYGDGMRPGGERVATGGNTYKWLTTQVQPAVMRSMYDHEEGRAIRDLIRAWAAEADMIDDALSIN